MRLSRRTPPRAGGHPVFVAQHATATCCRGCLAKWHHIEAGRALTDEEQAHVVAVIARWVRDERAAAVFYTIVPVQSWGRFVRVALRSSERNARG